MHFKRTPGKTWCGVLVSVNDPAIEYYNGLGLENACAACLDALGATEKPKRARKTKPAAKSRQDDVADGVGSEN